MQMDIFVGIKISDNSGLECVVDSATNKLLISDTTLRSFIPTKVHIMNPRLRQIYIFKYCITAKDMDIGFNRFRTNLVETFQQKYVCRHTFNSVYSTTSASHCKDKVFPYSECLHANIEDEDQCISVTPIKPKNIIHTNCDLGSCCECNKYSITDEELDDGPNSTLLHFSVYNYQGRCTKHGTIPNVPTLCNLCK